MMDHRVQQTLDFGGDDRGTVTRSGRRGVSGVREAAIILYSTMAILLFALPDCVADRLSDAPPSMPTEMARHVVQAIAQNARVTGLPQLYEQTRSWVLSWIKRGSGRRDGAEP